MKNKRVPVKYVDLRGKLHFCIGDVNVKHIEYHLIDGIPYITVHKKPNDARIFPMEQVKSFTIEDK